MPAFIERTADVNVAVEKIMRSKGFDYGTVCASEQSIIVETCNEAKARQAIIENGGFFLKGQALEKKLKPLWNVQMVV